MADIEIQYSFSMIKKVDLTGYGHPPETNWSELTEVEKGEIREDQLIRQHIKYGVDLIIDHVTEID